MLWLCTLLLAASPIDVADQKQLFIDHRFITDGQDVELRTNPAQKLGPVLDEAGQPLRLQFTLKRAKLYAFQFTPD